MIISKLARHQQYYSLYVAESSGSQLEQSMTIIPNLTATMRRKSMVNYAFPELHPSLVSTLYLIILYHLILHQTQLQPPSKNLLIYTRSEVDSTGRRHSVSIPLLPSSKARPDSTVISIQRKGSKQERGRVKTMGKIQENDGRVSANDNTKDIYETATTNPAMDCLTVPAATSQEWQHAARRKNSLPARKRSTSSERGTSRRSSKQG